MTDTRILKNPLFEDLSGREIDELMNCVGARVMRVERGGTVGLRNPQEPLFGILLSGTAFFCCVRRRGRFSDYRLR